MKKQKIFTAMPCRQKIILITALFVSFSMQRIYGQTFIGAPSGSQVASGTTCFNLTPGSGCGTFQSGAIWSTTQLNFNSAFSITFQATMDKYYVGGADGICVVFGQNLTTSTPPNNSSAGLGYYGTAIPQYLTNSFGVEFDTYNDGPTDNDIALDHCSIASNASYSSSNLLAAAVPINGTSGIKDGQAHTYTVKWNPTTNQLSIYWDCSLILVSYRNYRTLFTNPSAITWGITGSTGGGCSNQTICSIVALTGEAVIGCSSPGVSLTAPIAPPSSTSYAWLLPGGGTATTATYNATTSGVYTVTSSSCVTSVQETYSVTIAKCTGTLPACTGDVFLVDQSSEISSGGVMEHSSIQAGSTVIGGSGATVSPPTNINTTFIAGDIKLVPNFKATVDVNHFFEAIPTDACPVCGYITSIPDLTRGYSVQLTSTSGAGGEWFSNNPSVLSIDESTGYATGIDSGLVTVTYIIGNCIESVTFGVGCKPCKNPRIRDSTEAIDEIVKINEIVVFPNPAQNTITINYPCNSSGQLEINIKDVAGRTMHTEVVNCNEGSTVEHNIDISSYSPGVYFVELTLNDQHVVKKVVKL